MTEMSSSSLDPIIKEWLAEYKGLPESSISEYANEIAGREDISNALTKLFNSQCINENVIQPVCHQLFEFYRSEEKNLVSFTISLFPSIIRYHILSLYVGDSTAPTDTLLLSIYTISSSKSQDCAEFEVPQLGNPSIYHDPISGPFSDQMFNKQTTKRYYRKPYLPHYGSIVPGNRYEILTHILDRYFRHIGFVRKQSLLSLCDMCKYLAASGFSWQNKYLQESSVKQRYPLSGDFMMKMLRCLYFALYNKCFSEALIAVQAINRRGNIELIPQVIFLCNAILDSARELQEADNVNDPSPCGITSVNLTPLLSHEPSRIKGRFAATTKSLKDHRWRHHNEEISGDLSKSLQNPDMQGGSIKPPHGQDPDEAKTEKHSTTSPTKALKTKFKKSAAGVVTDKSKSPAPSTGDKKGKKTSDDQESQEKLRKSSSQHKELHPRYSSTSLQKHSSVDDASAASKTKANVSISKSSSDVTKASISAKNHGMQTSKDDSNSSTTALLDQSLQEKTSESIDSDERESYPLLPSNETPTKGKSTIEQTVF